MRPILLPLCALFAITLATPVHADELDDAEKAVVDLYDAGKLFTRTNYPALREAFAKIFEVRHVGEIRRAFGEDYDELTKWLDSKKNLKQDLYTAIDEKNDDVVAALAMFREIWKKHADKLDKWGQLAIAVSVVWDRPRDGVYDYGHHQVRAKSVMPPGSLGALENFKYVLDSEKSLVHPVQFYPWEFLVFVIDHKTPLKERAWSFDFLKSTKAKSWHQAVPYDMDMLNGEITRDPSLKPKLSGKEYTLANLKQYGGVCAHQADFASRVAKSLGAPAAYCWGKSSYRGLHAWWMHVHVTSATKDEIKFSLVSDGRYEGFVLDAFYTGEVNDPQTGKDILDRDLERRLWVTGNDKLGKRLGALLARAYPLVVADKSLDIKGKVAFLDKTLKVNKYDEFAWTELANLAGRGELTADQKSIVLSHLNSLATIFGGYPDFIKRNLDPMLEVVPSLAEKSKVYESTMGLFEKAKRPDLVCDTRLRLSEILIEEKKFESAHKGLTATIRKFPTEGRFVPKLASKLETISAEVKGGVASTSQLYVELVPAMIIHYKSADDDLVKKLADQARSFLSSNNQTQSQKLLESRISAASAAVGRKK